MDQISPDGRTRCVSCFTVLNVIYVLDPKLEPIREPSDKDSDKIVADRKKREEDELVC